MAAISHSHDAHWRAAAWLAALAGLTAITSRPGHGWLTTMDQAATSRVARQRSEPVIRAARAISAVAEPRAAVVPLAIAAAIAAKSRGWRAAWEPSLTVVGGMALRRGLAGLIARQRPPEAMWLVEPEGFSLPSKHTSLAALTAGACAAALGADRHVRDTAVVVAATSVGASRICLGVHWPTDVLAGWLFAEGWLDLLQALLPRTVGRTP